MLSNYYKNAISCFLKDIDPIFKICKNAFHVFWEILISYSKFPRKFKTGLHDCSVPVFSIGFPIDYFGNPGVSKDRIVGSGSRGRAQKSGNHRNDRFSVSPISKSKSH